MPAYDARRKSGNGSTRPDSSRTRARGFATWRPRNDAVELLAQVREVLDEYREHLPLTLRQVFYRLVGSRGYEKTETAYKRLGETLNRARRASLLPFDVIRDDGITTRPAPGWGSVDHFMAAVRHGVENFRLDRQAGQPRQLIIMSEAAGMVPQLERVAHPFGVEVLSSGGFDSTTAKHALACKVARLPRQAAVVLHLGDCDPSGVHVFSSLDEDVGAFAAAMGATVTFVRLAVTPAQVKKLGLPTAPAKPTDRRSFAGIDGDANATVQAEAIPPDELARIVRKAIAKRIDHHAYEAVLEAEQRAKASLAEILEPRP